MLFQITHMHTSERCPGVDETVGEGVKAWWTALKSNTAVKVLGGYVSPMDHTFHITIEADDYPTLARALGPLNSVGEGRTTPVITLDQAFPMSDEGAFRLE